MDGGWNVVLSFLPEDWRALARETGALKGLRKDKSVDALLRTLLLHLACGHSLRETVVRARKANLADLSDVTLLKRLRKSKAWLRALCVALFREQGIAVSADGGFQVRAFDATTAKEPGKTGALWRPRYSVRLPSLACDFFKLTPTEGWGTGEAFAQFPIGDGDFVLAGRAYSTAAGLHHVVSAGGHVIVRVNTGSLPLRTRDGAPFDLLAHVTTPKRVGSVRSWPVLAVGDGIAVSGRVCAISKDAGGHQARAAQAAQGGRAKRQTGSAANPGVRALRHRVHHLSRSGLQRHPGPGVVSHPLAGRTGLQALQVAGAVGASAQIRRRERQGVALRQTSGGVAGGKADPSCQRGFPLGIQPGGAAGRTVPGVTSGSCSTKACEPSSPIRPSSG